MISAVSAPVVQSFPPPSRSLAGRETVPVEAQTKSSAQSPGQLTDAEKEQVAKLKKIDQEVRAHEQAHKNAGGQFTGSASFGFVVGPDGRRYAVSGEVPIDVAPVEGDPRATIAKMQVVVAAALAPAKPSGQDRQVAAQAATMRAEAQAELAQEFQAELTGENDDGAENPNSLNISALAAYEAGSASENSKNISGNILDFFS
ncbi:MAG: hypothetical protein COB49_06555 [Alphaproteobacteria bacterium]|nr:MAG: hypothetical protein COB49_06555 [Alphaproteobacteria bacterium]